MRGFEAGDRFRVLPEQGESFCTKGLRISGLSAPRHDTLIPRFPCSFPVLVGLICVKAENVGLTMPQAMHAPGLQSSPAGFEEITLTARSSAFVFSDSHSSQRPVNSKTCSASHTLCKREFGPGQE